ncbi:hypothetical protein Barb7_01385 [Bacteroidales bacterium Barb7]|nr:hypothetical protein Barb7_01385 [Bacteroidales bacterium Barb7]
MQTVKVAFRLRVVLQIGYGLFQKHAVRAYLCIQGGCYGSFITG